MSEGLSRRVCPIGNTFINVPGCTTATAKRRSQSFSGYVTFQHQKGELPQPGDLVTDGYMHFATLDGSCEAVETLGMKAASTSDEISQQCTLQRTDCCWSDVSTTAETKRCQSCTLDSLPSVDVSCCSLPTTLMEPGMPTPSRHTIEEEFTTLMIRNLPHYIKQMDLLAELDENGFEGAYDFLYMPANFCSGHGKGYAFLNFIHKADARRFVSEWHKSLRFGAGRDRGGLSISVAAVQGREANIKKWDVPRMRRVKNPDFRPLIAVKPADGAPSMLVPSSLVDSEASLIAEVPQPGEAARRHATGQASQWKRHGQAPNNGRTGNRAEQARELTVGGRRRR